MLLNIGCDYLIHNIAATAAEISAYPKVTTPILMAKRLKARSNLYEVSLSIFAPSDLSSLEGKLRQKHTHGLEIYDP